MGKFLKAKWGRGKVAINVETLKIEWNVGKTIFFFTIIPPRIRDFFHNYFRLECFLLDVLRWFFTFYILLYNLVSVTSNLMGYRSVSQYYFQLIDSFINSNGRKIKTVGTRVLCFSILMEFQIEIRNIFSVSHKTV